MSEELDGVSVSFGISGAPMGESGEGVSGGTFGGTESKTLMENPSDKGILSDGVRVSEESKGSVGSTTRTIIGGSGWKGVDAGSLEINDKHDVSKKRVVEMMSRNNGWGSWGVMDLVGRVLEGKLSMDEEMEDIINSDNGPEENLVSDMNVWQGVVGEPTSENGIEVKGTTDNKNSDKFDSGCQSEGNGLNGKQDLVSNEIVPDGQLETEEVNNVIADELKPEGHVEANRVNADVLTPKGHLEVNSVNVDVLIPEACMEVNCDNADLLIPEGHVEVNNGNADLLIPEGRVEVNNVNDDVLTPKERLEVNNVNDDVLTPKGSGEHHRTEKEGEYCVSDLVWGKVRSHGNADLLIPEGRVEVYNVNDDVLTPKERLELNNVNDDVLTPKGSGEHHRTEKEGEYCVSDLVWGKVRSHPWWPGQIYALSAASDKAKKYFKRESHLVAYFGDQSFAWNEEAKIKPFRIYFSQMEKQSNADGFCNAVDCALDEVSRRVELGLSCPCLPQEIRAKIKFQDIANAGIREESSRIAGGDNLSSAASFLPGEFMQFLGSLAESPQSKTDRLQFVTKSAQLLAFNRWKGHYQLPAFEEFGELEDDTQSTVNRDGEDSQELMEGLLPGPESEGANDFPSKKSKSTARGGSSRKRKHISGEEESPKIKEKYISVLMSSSSSSLQNDEKKPVKRTGRKAASSCENNETVNSVPCNPQVKRRKGLLSPSSGGDVASKGKMHLTVGESICDSAEISETVEIIPAGIPTPDVILSELMLAAKKPLQRNGTILSVVGLLRELRNSKCLQKSSSDNATKDKGKQCSSLEDNDTFGFEGTKDSYWTDRIIQSCPQDQMFFEPDSPNERASELEANISVPLNLDNNQERNAAIVDLDTESEEYNPTALILNFTNLESIPSVTNLNEIFSRYGPLIESETKILSKSKRAKVIFKRRTDAETAFSSAGKYSIFGPSLISYRLNYAPTPRKSRAISKQSGRAHL